jgi:hypothetical protein
MVRGARFESTISTHKHVAIIIEKLKSEKCVAKNINDKKRHASKGECGIVLTCLTCEEMYKRINGLTVGFDSQFSYFPTKQI